MAHKTAAFDENIRQLIKEWKVPGLAIAIVSGDEINAKVFYESVLLHNNCLPAIRVTVLLI